MLWGCFSYFWLESCGEEILSVLLSLSVVEEVSTSVICSKWQQTNVHHSADNPDVTAWRRGNCHCDVQADARKHTEASFSPVTWMTGEALHCKRRRRCWWRRWRGGEEEVKRRETETEWTDGRSVMETLRCCVRVCSSVDLCLLSALRPETNFLSTTQLKTSNRHKPNSSSAVWGYSSSSDRSTCGKINQN